MKICNFFSFKCPPQQQNVKEKSEEQAKINNYTLNESRKGNNRRLNRYRDVNPYDHSRYERKKNILSQKCCVFNLFASYYLLQDHSYKKRNRYRLYKCKFGKVGTGKATIYIMPRAIANNNWAFLVNGYVVLNIISTGNYNY